ncbi:hypothetical protein O9X81_00080 [Agrobacterium salinitolerans]|uniref:hypothetical protein n=1 Tax=Agrobacterium salinitolerans TaxID=1183413 RepID=UPI0022B84B28|nr:hypothetical protein [Agrobacterium salinitolerans]MCZ7855005.1 hypothetical protein [Agrobacterium salinitolerans]
MWKFKKGDFVRRTAGESLTTNDGRHGAGFVGQIADIVKGFTTKVVFTNGHAGLIEMYEPWHPRLGERVKVTGNDKWAGDGEVTELRNYGVFVVLMKTGRFAGKPGGFYIRDIEPILTDAAPEKPATMKIEAGRFYRTRDGRKAKIERSHYGDSYDFVATFEGWSGNKVYKKDGKHGSRWIANNSSDDLIAEWIDEPVAKASNDNAAPKFKVGDRVKCLKSYAGKFTAGKEYVVSADYFGREYESVKVKFDDAGSTENGWLPEFFELVTPKPTTTIVALIENGQPKPSSWPHVHTSGDAAEREAKRLAAKYKGKQFGVFTLTTTHEEAAPVYDHKWQNMAALGLKIDAIKELRAVAGLDLLSAKRAVEAFEQAA